MTTTSTRPVRWRAGKDGIGHAFTSDHAGARTACGQVVPVERLAWPVDVRCLACRAALEAVPETEQRALWGDR